MFGGTGIQRERSAAGVGLCCPQWNPEVIDGTFELEGRFDREFGVQTDDLGRSLPENWNKLCKDNKCNQCAEKIIGWYMNRDNRSEIMSNDSPDTFTDIYSELYVRLCVSASAVRLYVRACSCSFNYLSLLWTLDLRSADCFNFRERDCHEGKIRTDVPRSH